MAGITFSEVMHGGFALGSSNPAAGEQAGQAAGNELAMHATVTIPSIGRFLDDPQHSGNLTGAIDCPALGDRLPAEGQVRLLIPGADSGLRHMVYRFEFLQQGQPRCFLGRKDVRDDSGEVDLWADTTTLYSTLHEGDTPASPAIGAGILRLGIGGLVDLVRSIRYVDAQSTAEGLEAVARFGKFFLGSLWETYMTHAGER